MGNNANPICLNGVGTAYLNVVNNGVTQTVPLGTLQDMTLEFSGSLEKIYGSDSPYPVYIIDKDQECKVSFTEARFSLDWLSFVKGATMSNNGTLISNTPATLIATGTAFTVPGSLTTLIPTSAVVIISDDALGLVNPTPLKYKATAPSATEFTMTAAGVITLGASVTNKYISVNALYTDTVSRAATVTNAGVPGFVSIRHISKAIDMGDGVKNTIHTVIHRAKSDGKLTLNHKRQSADAQKLDFEVFYDTTRTDGILLQMSQLAV